MSGWDAPTGSWDSPHEPDESGGPDEQGYKQDEPAGGHRAGPGGEGRVRAGRRGLPGYDQAQDNDQTTADYDQGPGYGLDSGHGPGSGYGQQSDYGQPRGYGRHSAYGQPLGYDSGSSSHPGHGLGSGTGQMVRHGQRPADEATFGSGPQDPLGSGRPDPLGSGWPDPLGSGPPSTFSSGPRHASESVSSQQPPSASSGPGLQGVSGYGEDAAGAYRQYGADEPTRLGWSDAGGPPGYGAQPGYGSSSPDPGYSPGGFSSAGPDSWSGFDSGYGTQHDYHQQDQQGYRQQGYDQTGYGAPGFSPPGAEPSGYPQSGYGESGYGENGFGRDRFAQDGPSASAQDGASAFVQDTAVTQAYGIQSGYGQNGFSADAPSAQTTYPPDGYVQDGYVQDGYGQDGYGQDGSGPAGFGSPGTAQDGYPPDDYARSDYAQSEYVQDGYPKDGYGQQGFDQPAAPGYDEDFTAGRRRARSRSGSHPGPQRLGGTRMVLYLAASVIGVVAIVFVVIHLARSGGGTPAGGSTTPSAQATNGAAATGYSFKLPSAVGQYPLNRPAGNDLSTTLKSHTVPMLNGVRSAGAGHATTTVSGIYNLGPVSSVTSSSYKGITFVGYDGTFSPASAIKVIRAHLVSSRVVPAGAHGGQMVCGYNTSTGSDASMCVWVTPTTLGSVQFLIGDHTVKYPGSAKLALQVRNAVEVPAS